MLRLIPTDNHKALGVESTNEEEEEEEEGVGVASTFIEQQLLLHPQRGSCSLHGKLCNLFTFCIKIVH